MVSSFVPAPRFVGTEASTRTVGELYGKLADAVQQIAAGIFMAPTHIVMHPRWAWFAMALDTTNRPLVVPTGGMNSLGTSDASADHHGEAHEAANDAPGGLAADGRRSRYQAAVEPDVRASTRVGSEPRTYAPGSDRSYFGDLVRATRDGDAEAEDRLRQHAKEIRIDAEARVRAGQVEFRDLTRVDGAGGQFMPPLHLVDQYVSLARASRPTANIVGQRRPGR